MNAWLKKDFRCRIEFASAPHTLPITLSQWLFHIMTRLGLRDTIKISWAPPALSLWPDLPIFVYKLWITWKYGCPWWPIFLPYGYRRLCIFGSYFWNDNYLQWLFHTMTCLGLRDTIKISWGPPALLLWPDLPVFVYKLNLNMDFIV